MKAISTLIASAALVSIAGAQNLSIKGSDTLGAKLVPQLAEEIWAKLRLALPVVAQLQGGVHS